jgi:hypothetical protein
MTRPGRGILDLDLLGDLAGWTCALCGRPVERREATADHRDPQRGPGWHTPENIQLTHVSCNSVKGKRSRPEVLLACRNQTLLVTERLERDILILARHREILEARLATYRAILWHLGGGVS